MKQSAFPRRHIWLAIAGFVAMIVGMSAARTQPERVLYGAAQMAFAVMCLGRAAWLYSEEVARLQEFVWRFRRYSGRQVMGFVYGMKAGAIAFALMGVWALAMWLMELRARLPSP